MKKYISISVFLVLLATLASFGQLIDDSKLMDINDLLKKYEQYNQFTADGNMIDAGYSRDFVNLFDPILFQHLYNDMSASKDNPSDFGSAMEYMQVNTKNYPNGIDVTLDMSKMKVVDVFHSKSKNGYVVMVPKKTAGLYRGKKVFRSTVSMYLFVSEAAGDKKSDFKISGALDPVGYQKYCGTKAIKGLYVGFQGGYGQTMVFNAGASARTDIYRIEHRLNMSFGFELSYMFTRGFGLGSGIGLNTYSSSFAIDSYKEISSAYLIDQDGDGYNPVLDVNGMVETDVYESIEIPMLLKFRTGKGKTAVYMDLGVVYSMISGYYTQEGRFSRSGYYPEWRVTLEDIADYDFYTNKALDGSQKELTVPSGGLSAYAALGISIPLSHGFYMKLGANARYGISDVGLGTDRHALSLGDFVADPGATTLNCGGLEMGLSYNVSELFKK